MILHEAYNIPVAAPEIDNMPDALNQFREWRGNEALQMVDFIAFLKVVSDERENFFSFLENNPIVISGRYVIQKLN